MADGCILETGRWRRYCKAHKKRKSRSRNIITCKECRYWVHHWKAEDIGYCRKRKLNTAPWMGGGWQNYVCLDSKPKKRKKTSKERELAEKYVRSMVKHGFMHGVMGDRSEAFIRSQIKTVLTKTVGVSVGIASSVSNLVQYCGWTREDVEELGTVFGFVIVDRPDLVAGMAGEPIRATVGK